MFKTVISFLPFFVCLFWLVTFAARTAKNDNAKRVLTVFLAVCTVLYLCHAIYFNSGLNHTLNCIWALCSLSVYPLYYLYIHTLTNGGRMPAWILIPGAVVAGCLYLFPGTASEIARKLLFFVQVIGVCWLGILKLHRFDKEVSSIYADTEGRSVSSIKSMLCAFVVTSTLSAAANAIGKQFFNNSNALLTAVAVLFAVMLYLISYLGYNRDFTVEKMAEDIPEDDHEAHETEDDMLGKKIEHCLNEEMLYLQKGLKIGELVQKVGSCRTYVSNYINQTKGMSFSDYINSMRIEKAKQIIISEHDMKMVDLADRMGFTSEQSFFRNFKKFTGMTPAQWKKKNSSR